MEYFIKFPGGREKAMTLSYDDGVETDARLIAIMRQHGLKGTFNLNSELFEPEGTVFPEHQVRRVMTRSRALEVYPGSGMEIACHGCTHPDFNHLPPERIVYETLRDRENLEKMFGCMVRGMAYPYGTYDDPVPEIMRGCGIAYGRAAAESLWFDIPKDPIKWIPTCHHNNPALFGMLDDFFRPEVEADHPRLFYLWGHSYEFDGDKNWDRIEEFAEKAGGHEDVWYATNIEVIDYLNAVRALRFSADGMIIENPTATDVWIYFHDQFGPNGLYRFPAGETVILNR